MSLGEFGVVSLGENIPGFFFAAPNRWLPIRTRSRVEVFLTLACLTMEHSCLINMTPSSCPASLSDAFFLSHLCCMLSRRQFTRIPPNTPCVRVAGWSPQYVQSCYVVLFPPPGIQKCWCGTIANTFSQCFGQDNQDHRPFSLVSTTSRLRRQLFCVASVLSSTSGLHYSRWESGGICQVLTTTAFTLFCHDVHGLKEGFLSFFVTFVMESCSRVCLLVVSRLLGLTLYHFTPVCSCHRDSLTRGRLAFSQEAVRVFFFSVFSIGPCS